MTKIDLTSKLKTAYSWTLAAAWPAWLTGGLLGFINVLEYWFATPWGVTTPESRWGGWFLESLGVSAGQLPYFREFKLNYPWWQDGGTWLIIGMVLGSFIAASLSREFRLRVTSRVRLLQGVGGGMLMGYGARLAYGCNLGAYFSAIPQLSPFGWLFLLGMAGGAYGGVRLILKWA